jgi:tetratricopeptide (TPR) repeat protein
MKKTIFLILFTFSLINQFKCQTEQALLEQVKINLNKGNIPEVLLNCTKILNINSTNETARLYRAEALMNIMQFDSSLKEIEKVLVINANNGQAYNLKGRIKLRLYDFKRISSCEDAKENFDIALKLNPNDITVINNLGYYYQYCIGDIKSSIEQYDKSIAIKENQPDIFYSRGNLKGDLHDTVGAINDYTSAIKLNPKCGAYFVERAKIYQNNGDYKKSFEDYNKAMIADSSVIAFIGRGFSAYSLKKYDIAIIDFTHVIDKTLAAEQENHNSIFSYNCPSAYYYRGLCYYYTKQINKSCKDWENAIKRGVSDAKELISTYCKLDPITYLNRGRTKYDEEDFNGALENLNTYLGTNPNSEEAIILRGHCKYVLKDYQGAINDYNTCLNFNSKNIDALFYCGNSYYETNNYKAAITYYNKITAIDSKNIDAFYQLGLSKFEINDYKGALICYNTVIKLGPKVYENEIYFKRAVIKSSLGDKLGSILDYTESLKFDPENSATYINRGMCKSSLKDIQGAINDFTSAIEQEPTFAAAYYNRGLHEFKLGNKVDACSDIRTAMELGYVVTGTEIKEICK